SNSRLRSSQSPTNGSATRGQAQGCPQYAPPGSASCGDASISPHMGPRAYSTRGNSCPFPGRHRLRAMRFGGLPRATSGAPSAPPEPLFLGPLDDALEAYHASRMHPLGMLHALKSTAGPTMGNGDDFAAAT